MHFSAAFEGSYKIHQSSVPEQLKNTVFIRKGYKLNTGEGHDEGVELEKNKEETTEE